MIIYFLEVVVSVLADINYTFVLLVVTKNILIVEKIRMMRRLD